MLRLTKGNTDEEIIVTLNEYRTLEAGYYLFVFENITTKELVKKVYNFTEDESSYQDRYNQFSINTQSLFGTKNSGEYTYKVYESETNTTDPTGLNLVEYGIMKLSDATAFEFETYQSATTYKAYAG